MQNIQDEILQNFGHQLRLRVSGICLQNSQILLIKHHFLGENKYLWSPPGGGLQFGESAEEGLKREFREETGLEIQVEKFLFVNEFLAPPLHAIELFFEVKIIGGSLQIGTDPEMSAHQQIIKNVAFLDENPQISLKFNVRNIPTLLFFKNGQLVDKQVGYVPKNVLAQKLDANL